VTGFLTTLPSDPLLDLDPWVGQRQCTFRFDLTNGVTGEKLGELHPLREASLTHDTSRTIKRELNISLGVSETAEINVITDRVSVFMVFPNGTEYPLGIYMFTDNSRQVFHGAPAGVHTHTAGGLGSMTLNDEMFLVDQQIVTGINGIGTTVMDTIQATLKGLPVTFEIESSPYNSAQAWTVGTNRGQILEALAESGDYFSPWFDNFGVMRFIRSFNPAMKIPSFDFDAGNKVIREPIVETDDLITAPNVFIVVSNTSENEPIVATAAVPFTAPHSVFNRGFEIPEVQNLQLSDSVQAQAVVEGLANRKTVFERVALTTAPDPRHDSYDVIRWQEKLYLELSWSMALVEGGQMNHLLRRGYGNTNWTER
jgi:hypothetical protein